MAYQGWKNHATWNVALWISNDRGWYALALEMVTRDRRAPYRAFVAAVRPFSPTTGDGVAWDDPTLDRRALNAMLRELAS